MLHSSSQTSIKTTLKRTARGPGLVQVWLLVTAKQHTSRPGGWKETLALSLSRGPTEKLSCTNTFSPALNKPLTARGRPATAAILPSEQEMKSWRRQQEQRMAGSTEEWKTAEMDRRAKERKGVGKRERERWRCTYVDLTQNDVYNAANYDEEVKNIPGVTKVTLHRTRGRWGWGVREGS